MQSGILDQMRATVQLASSQQKDDARLPMINTLFARSFYRKHCRSTRMSCPWRSWSSPVAKRPSRHGSNPSRILLLPIYLSDRGPDWKRSARKEALVGSLVKDPHTPFSKLTFRGSSWFRNSH